MQGKIKIWLIFVLAAIIIIGASLIYAFYSDPTTTEADEIDWKASPFRIYVAQEAVGDQYKIVALYSDGTGLIEVITISKSAWQEQQKAYMSGYVKNGSDYIGSNLSPNSQIKINYTKGFLGKKTFRLQEGSVEKILFDGLVWPVTWFYSPEAFYWLPDSRHILVEDKGSIYVIQASDGQYAKLIEGVYPSLYQPQ